ncbi:MAG: extracellular solute-binding protein, partial [Caldilineaceae bacterium]|nr:extracellular solute-binding protein [Caldilineaceae bacterium]
KAGMLLAGPDFLTELPEPLRADLAFVPFPVIDPNVTTGEVAIASGYVAPATATHSDEALRFLEYAVTDAGADALASIALEQALVPATGIQGLENIPDQLLEGARLVSQANVVRPPFIFGLTFDEQAAYGRVIDTMLREVNADGTFNVENALTALGMALQ